MWVKEASGKVCPSSDRLSDGPVTDQQSCQLQCELNQDCIGIAYSQLSHFNDWCFICFTDTLSDFGHQFGFYRRPGKMALKLANDLIKQPVNRVIFESFNKISLSY